MPGSDWTAAANYSVPTPTANGHAATKAYIDTLETKIADALNASSDYGAFKTALLAALG